ncbi:MAG TPA: hypothetical protein VNB64_03850 [Solirubrobacteraceae bacterium]|nr:hypothetical protein [Solirubrobacteraceae bacterium]
MSDELTARDLSRVTRGRTVLTKWYRYALSTEDGLEGEPSTPICPAVQRLAEARELIVLGHHGPAMVTAQALSDAYFGEAMSSLFADHEMGRVGEAISSALRGYSLGRNEHIGIYDALTGEQLRETPFWSHYRRGRTRRDRWTHGLQDVSADSADFVIAVADLIEHVEQVLERLGAQVPPTELGAFEQVEGGWAMDIRRRRDQGS